MKPTATLVAIAFLLAGIGRATAVQPMDLANPEARWVSVQVVTTSPGDPHPRLSPPARAWYELGPQAGERLITVPGSEVEAVLFADRSPVDRSFSDFVWILDAESGHVSAASFSGRVHEPVEIGPLRTAAQVSIAVLLSTHMPGGYQRPRRIAGRTVIGYCADSGRPDCSGVAGAVYDAESGWVRANGAVCASWRSLRTLAYTSLGHARFAELRPGPSPSAPPQRARAAPPRAAAHTGAPTC